MPNNLHSIRTFKQLVRYLEDELDWPLEGYEIEDLTFDYEPDELGLKAEDAAKVKSIRQLRPLDSKQPWGIFFIEFDKKKLPVVVLRRILSHLVVKKRASANKADRVAWSAEDLLFISAFGEDDDDGREISFAHFHQEEGDMPTLRVLGWDGGDTKLKLDHLDTTLRRKLHWPQNNESLDHWRARWSGVFRHRIGHVINTSNMLAEAMALLAKRIRDAAQTLIERESDKGPLRKLHQAFKTNLIHDLTEEGFADTYAQTITYGLLTAAISRTEMSEGKHGTMLVASNVTDMVPVTNPFLKEMLQTFLHAGGRKGGMDFDELGVQDVVELLRGEETDLPAILRDFGNKTRGEDPVIHFYQDFLESYNKKLRIQRGVFYTPQPVVSYIVRSVHELLQSEFGLADGLADTTTWGAMLKKHPGLKLPPLTDEPGEKRTISPDEPFVQILDPATGTATFLVEVIEVIHRTLAAKWKQQRLTDAQQRAAWNDYVPQHLLPRLHAFELMMAPYAIAHMKIGLKLAETGYRFGTEERARIYLTNALEQPDDKQTKLIGFDALAHEAEAVNEIKRHKRFTVVIGNPPYSHLSSNLTRDAMAIVEPYKFINGVRIQERGALSLQKNLQDDYVKFIRISERTIETAGYGVVGLITNNSYLDSRSFRGMRCHLSQTFSEGWLLDLHGSGKKNEAVEDSEERDANVFDIMQGVAVAMWTRPFAKAPTQIRRADLLGGRERKYQFLANQTVATISWKQIQIAPPFFPFVEQDMNLLTEYQTLVSLREIFPVYSSGVKTHRDDFAYSFTASEMEEKLRQFCDRRVGDDKLREHFGLKDTNVWSLPAQRAAVRLPSLCEAITAALYRPFDIRTTCFSNEIIELARRAVMDQMVGGENLALLCSQQQAEEGYRHAFCTRLISDWGSVSNRTRESTSAFPLWLSRPVRKSLSQHDLNLGEELRPNVNPAWLRAFGSAEGVFHYVYSLLHAPSYRARYAAFLRSDFPRLPLTGNLDLFRELAGLGGELAALHLLESPQLAKPITAFIGTSEEVTKIGWTNNTVWINASGTKGNTTAGTSGFRGVPEAVWNFQIGGYQVCEKWLKDRKGRTLTDEDIAHYQKIIIALTETIRLMSEIDQVIESHGGWPGAFSTP